MNTTQDARNNSCEQKQHLRLSAKWSALMRRLLAVGDGEHIIIISKQSGLLIDWRHAEVGKPEQV